MVEQYEVLRAKTKEEGTGVRADDAMSEAGRKILAFHFARMLKEETAVRKGSDVEAVHDMRVATRRMRSAIRIYSPFFEEAAIRPLARRLRKIARLLGAVRDLDVFRLKAEAYADTLSRRERKAFQPLLDTWQAQEDAARIPLIKYLDGRRYATFIERFTDFVLTPGKGALRLEVSDPEGLPVPHRVCDIAPRLIYTQYGAVHAYAPYLTEATEDALHALRIEIKRLRYTLEAFADVLGPEAATAIDATKAMQDHLGDLQDARVAVGMLAEYLAAHTNADSSELISAATVRAVQRYMAWREDERARLKAGVLEAWSAFATPDVRRAMALAVAVL